MQPDFDCLIIGSGLVGGALACALDHALKDPSARIGVVEAFQASPDFEPSYNDRGLGISPASQRILQGIGLWDSLVASATPIRNIHVTDRGHFGFTRISATKLGVEQLGHVVIGKAVGQVLQETISQSTSIEYICPATVTSLSTQAGYREVQIKKDGEEKTVTTRLLIVADGGQSQVRKMLGVEASHKDYQQTAIVTNVTPEREHNNTAYERFTNTGPLALLPLSDQRCVVVWTVNSDQASTLQNLDEQTFLAELGKRFGHRLGNFTKVGERRCHPMHLIKASQLTGDRFVIIGNAAHTIHPNAAQGLNLGLRDVAQLAEQIVDAIRSEKDPGLPDLLTNYAESRQRDHQQVVRFSDGLSKLFYNDNPALITFRNLAMLGVDLFPSAKRNLTRRWMGLNMSGQLPRLVRGQPL